MSRPSPCLNQATGIYKTGDQLQNECPDRLQSLNQTSAYSSQETTEIIMSQCPEQATKETTENTMSRMSQTSSISQTRALRKETNANRMSQCPNQTSAYSQNKEQQNHIVPNVPGKNGSYHSQPLACCATIVRNIW